MLADALTKFGNRDFARPLIKAYSSGRFCLEASAESTVRKLKAAKARKAKKDDSATTPSQPKNKRPRKAQKKPTGEKTLDELVENTQEAFALLDVPEQLPDEASNVSDSTRYEDNFCGDDYIARLVASYGFS